MTNNKPSPDPRALTMIDLYERRHKELSEQFGKLSSGVCFELKAFAVAAMSACYEHQTVKAVSLNIKASEHMKRADALARREARARGQGARPGREARARGQGARPGREARARGQGEET